MSAGQNRIMNLFTLVHLLLLPTISLSTKTSCPLKKSHRKLSPHCVSEPECEEICSQEVVPSCSLEEGGTECRTVTERECVTTQGEDCRTREEEECTEVWQTECSTEYTEQCDTRLERQCKAGPDSLSRPEGPRQVEGGRD